MSFKLKRFGFCGELYRNGRMLQLLGRPCITELSHSGCGALALVGAQCWAVQRFELSCQLRCQLGFNRKISQTASLSVGWSSTQLGDSTATGFLNTWKK